MTTALKKWKSPEARMKSSFRHIIRSEFWPKFFDGNQTCLAFLTVYFQFIVSIILLHFHKFSTPYLKVEFSMRLTTRKWIIMIWENLFCLDENLQVSINQANYLNCYSNDCTKQFGRKKKLSLTSFLKGLITILTEINQSNAKKRETAQNQAFYFLGLGAFKTCLGDLKSPHFPFRNNWP